MARRRILVVERDRGLRESFEASLEELGYLTAGTADSELAAAALYLSEQPMVVLLGHTGPWEVGSALLRRLGALPPHAYVLLSAQPAAAPVVRNPTTRLVIPVLEIPCDLDMLLTGIEDAAMRLEQRVRWELGQSGSRLAASLA
jgi:DNA-binding NtrC family response regulator